MRASFHRGAVRLVSMLYWLALILLVVIGGSLGIQGLEQVPQQPDWPVPGGEPERGRIAIQRHSCGSCHAIEGVPAAQGRVGPRLAGFREQTYIAGRLPNVTPNLMRWLINAQEVDPGNVMPDLPVTEPEARDIAAYLYSLK